MVRGAFAEKRFFIKGSKLGTFQDREVGCLCRDSNQLLSENKLSYRINLPLFSIVVPACVLMFLSCRPFVAITTLSTGLVGVVTVY